MNTAELIAQVDEIVDWTRIRHGDKDSWDTWARRFCLGINRTLNAIVSMRETYPIDVDFWSQEATDDDARRSADHCAGCLVAYQMGYFPPAHLVMAIEGFNRVHRPGRYNSSIG